MAYMWEYDPAYVREMSSKGYDPHTALAVFAGEMTKEYEDFFKWFDALSEQDKHDASEADKKLYGKCKATRKIYKGVNYACIYGAGAATVSRAAGCSLQKAEKLVAAYWKRNWSVKQIAENQITKTCMGQKWLYNPVSRLWYSLRYERDIFSTLNQGTGVWCFDCWVKHVKKDGPPILAQFHDEVVCLVKLGIRERVERHLRRAMVLTNDELQLNRELDCSVDFGCNYGEIH